MEDFRVQIERGQELVRAGERRGRYAPSPTGELHLGNIQAALCAWAHARLTGSTLILRIEDLDVQRCRVEYEQHMLEDLAWLGLDFDEGPGAHDGPVGPYRQSERVALYEQALEELKTAGSVYPCYCTRKEIAATATRSASGELVYAGMCRGLTPEGRARRERERGAPAWRFVPSPGGVMMFRDGVRDELGQDVSVEVGDFLVKRRDGVFSYQLAVVVDDICMGVTDVVRGEDLYTSTPRQLSLYEAFGVKPPDFWHVPLVLGEDGKKLSKRDRAHGVRALADEGWSAERVLGHLAHGLGWVERGRELSVDDVLEVSDFASLGGVLTSAP